MADSAWREVVLKTIRERPWKDGKGFGLWVVQKIRDGKSHEVTVRAGMFYTDKVTGEKKFPKEGMTEADFNTIGPVYKTEVLPLLQIPKGTVVDPRTEGETAPAAPEPELPPWMQ